MRFCVQKLNRYCTIWLVGWLAATIVVACAQTNECGTWDVPSVSELVGRNVVSTGTLTFTISTYTAVRALLIGVWFTSENQKTMYTWTVVFEIVRLFGLVLLAIVTFQTNQTIHLSGAFLAAVGSFLKGCLRIFDEAKHPGRRIVHSMVVVAAIALLTWFYFGGGNGWVELVGLMCIAVENLFDGIDYKDWILALHVAQRGNGVNRPLQFKTLQSYCSSPHT